MASQAIESQKTKLCINALTETVTISLKTSSNKITRASGSWVTDGVVAGTIISTNSTGGNKGPFLAKTVTATDITIDTDSSRASQGFATAFVAKSSVSHILKLGLWVKEMISFTGFDGEAGDIDVTSMDSTAKEFKQGLADNGGFKADFNYVLGDAGQLAMRAARRARTLQNFQLRYSDNSIEEFSANVKGNPKSGGVDSKIDTSFSLRISGAISEPSAAFVTGT